MFLCKDALVTLPRRLLLLAFVSLLAYGARADTRPLFGNAQSPLSLRTPGTLHDLFLDMVQWDARSMTSMRLDASWALANNWSTPTTLSRGGQEVTVRLDEQTDSLSVAYRLPWGSVLSASEESFWHRLTSAIEIRGTVHSGGYTDPLINWWHDLIGFNDAARRAYPNNEIHLELRNPGTDGPVYIQGTTFAFGDVILRNQLLLWEGGESTKPDGPRSRAGVSVRLDIKAPTGSLGSAGGSGTWDFGAAVLGTFQATPWLILHGMAAGALNTGMPGGLPLQPRIFQWNAALSIVLTFGDFSFIMEDRCYGPLFESGWNFVASAASPWGASAANAVLLAQNEITGGLRYGPMTFWFMEDFTPGGGDGSWYYNTRVPDVAFGLNFSMDI